MSSLSKEGSPQVSAETVPVVDAPPTGTEAAQTPPVDINNVVEATVRALTGKGFYHLTNQEIRDIHDELERAGIEGFNFRKI